MARDGSAVLIADIVVDCLDVDLVASFWAALLDRAIEGSRGPLLWLAPRQGQPGLVFQTVDAPTQGKNRMHFDLRTADVRRVRDRVEALGGRRVPGYEEGGFLVMADPEGNEFCLLPAGPLDLDDEGRAHYLPE